MQKILKIVFILSRSKLKCHKETWHSFFTSGTYMDTKMILYSSSHLAGFRTKYLSRFLNTFISLRHLLNPNRAYE